MATNSVIAPLPSVMEVDAAKVAFESFGEVFKVKRLEQFNNFVQVIFYDVRAADRAVKAFGEAGCIPGPQVGERTVMMAGDDQLSTKDFQKISEVLKSKDGAFFLEFYDIRDAMRYAPKEALQLVSPTAAQEPKGPRRPPGLGPMGALECATQVVIQNLPTKLLTQVMMEAVFQQAGFQLLDFNIMGDKVVAYFDDQVNAQKCVGHFSGCQWDKSGMTVTTEIIPASDAAFGSVLSAEAPAFQPVQHELQAEAAPFVPSWRRPKVDEAANTSRRAGKLATGSNTSTEAGDSEDDEKSTKSPRTPCPLPHNLHQLHASNLAGWSCW